MLGRKAAEIRSLEARNRDLEAAQPFIELAVEIGQRAAQSVQGINVEGHFDQILQDVKADERKRLLQQQFDALPPEERLKALAHYMPDEELQEVLRAEKVLLIGKSKIEKVAKQLARSCQEYCHVDLAQIPAGAEVHVHLHNMQDFRDHPEPEALATKTKQDRSLRCVSQGDGVFQTLSDTYYNIANHEKLNASPKLRAHEVIRLGTTLDESAELAYTAFYGAPLMVQSIDNEKNSKRQEFSMHYGKKHALMLGVGQILVNNIEVMGPSALPKIIKI